MNLRLSMNATQGRLQRYVFGGLAVALSACLSVEETEAVAIDDDSLAVPLVRSPNAVALADGSPCSSSLDCDSGQCNTVFADPDEDGFAVAGAAATSFCSSGANPSGFTSRSPQSSASADCLENNASVFPGQVSDFAVPAAGKATLPFDYDCDGLENSRKLALNAIQSCGNEALGACEARGSWVSDPSVPGAPGVPACGEVGFFSPCAELPQFGGACGAVAGGPALRPCR